MPLEIFHDRIRPGFPQLSNDGKSHRTLIEYVGLNTDLVAGCPVLGDTFGEYLGIVEDVRIEPLECTDYAILTVSVGYKFDASEDEGVGELRETSYELDWVDVQRSMYEHPEFSANGTGAHKLTTKDIAAIKLWEAETKIERKEIYKYQSVDPLNGYTAEFELTANAKMFARGIEMGIEYWIDKAPLARISETYVNGPPPQGQAGQKESPSGFPNLPSGYEWIRSADRGMRAGGQRKWQRDIEWIGAKKVLVDVDEIYWAAP